MFPACGHKGVVHFGNVTGRKHIVGVDNEEAVHPRVSPLGVDPFKQIAVGIARRAFRRVVILIDVGPVRPGDLSGAVGTVVGHNKHRQFFLRVIASPDAVQQGADHRLLVTGGNDNAILQQAACLGIGRSLEHANQGKYAVMEQQEKETAPDGNKNNGKSCQISHIILHSFNPSVCPAPKGRGTQTADCQPPRLTPVAVVLIHW